MAHRTFSFVNSIPLPDSNNDHWAVASQGFNTSDFDNTFTIPTNTTPITGFYTPVAFRVRLYVWLSEPSFPSGELLPLGADHLPLAVYCEFGLTTTDYEAPQVDTIVNPVLTPYFSNGPNLSVINPVPPDEIGGDPDQTYPTFTNLVPASPHVISSLQSPNLLFAIGSGSLFLFQYPPYTNTVPPTAEGVQEEYTVSTWPLDSRWVQLYESTWNPYPGLSPNLTEFTFQFGCRFVPPTYISGSPSCVVNYRGIVETYLASNITTS